MILFKEVPAFKKYLIGLKKKAQTVGFVPTMGALHNGHISLITECKQCCDVTVCSIFVNPTQFNDPKDYEKYPVTIENDILLLEQSGADILFIPSVASIYPEGLTAGIHYDIGYLENILEGYYRPGHFQGVCRVLHKFLEIVEPGVMFLGRKDYQQCMVVKKLLDLYNIPTQLKIADTLREAGGLAMSSRNMRLSEAEREKALVIYQAINFIKANIYNTAIPQLKQKAIEMILQAGFEKVDYVEICDADTLVSVERAEPNTPLVALVAAFIGGVRLIDNMAVS